MIKNILIQVLVLMVLTVSGGAAFSAVSDNTLIDQVKVRQNSLSVPCSELPRAMETFIAKINRDLSGQRESAVSSDWSVVNERAKNIVRLSFVVNTSVMIDTVSLSYTWTPQFDWVVDSAKGAVIPANDLAQYWMTTGKIRYR